nr:serine/threonine-protein kinase [Kofleriaceae bacterium]
MVERRDPMVGRVMGGRYRVDLRLAAGGFGAVYRGTDLADHSDVAIKILHSELAANDDSAVARFRREGDTLSSLRDPHTVTALSVGETEDGTLYIVMELLHGESLYDLFRATGAMSWRRVARIARAVCSSLVEAHALGIVHRDLKPANIHLEHRGDERDFVKVVDFGIAKLLAPGSSDLTHAGQMIGTFDYMAPEQMVGGLCTGRCDIYTLGVVMYEMIAGARPFGDCNGPTGLLAEMLTKKPPPLASRVVVPLELNDLVMRCLEREQQQRVQTVDEIAAVLDALLHDDDDDGVTRIVRAGDVDDVDERTVAARPPARKSAPVTPRSLPRATPPPLIVPPQPVIAAQQSTMDARGTSWSTPPRSMPAMPAMPVPDGFPMPAPTPMPMPIAQPVQALEPQPPFAPQPFAPQPHRPSTRHVSLPRYDMQGAANHDALVRRLMWIAALLVAIAIIAVVAHHL